MKKFDLPGRIWSFYCDRCKKRFTDLKPGERDDGSTGIRRGVTIPLPVVSRKQVSFKEKDLCGSCVTDLSKWMRRRS